MSEDLIIHEPPVDPLEDTSPSLTMRAVEVDEQAVPPRGRAAGAISLLAAAGLTLASVFLLAAPSAPPVEADPIAVTFTPAPTLVEPTSNPSENVVAPLVNPTGLPTLSAEGAAVLLSTPPMPVQSAPSGQIARNPWDPFTIIPDRPRNEIETYSVVEGDTIFRIAERYGLQPESVVWCNDNRIIHGLRPGMEINIPPIDGVCHRVIGPVNTVEQIASQYGVTDPYAVIDAEFNNLPGVTPDTVLPSNTLVVVPGGQREQISWAPVVERSSDGGGGNSSGAGWISFASGEVGSCGRQTNDISGTVWASPMGSYTFTQGFSSWHSGVDLAASAGAPVRAANSGRVIFAGWNSFGYGYTVVLASGPFTTLYGHLSAIYVSCGQVVSAGDSIAAVGSTGDSSGPHLHFEIRYLDTPTDPTATIGF